MRKGIWSSVMVMALLLTVAAPIPGLAATDFFTDDNGNIHEANINKIAELGITKGCVVRIVSSQPASPEPVSAADTTPGSSEKPLKW